MSDFAASWKLSRSRFAESVSGLNHAQLNWRIHPQALTLGESVLHVVGVEVSFIHQLLGSVPEGLASRLVSAATEGVVNDLPFPFAAEEITPELIATAFELGEELVKPYIENLSAEMRGKQIKSALGPMIDGNGAFARLGFHAGYHQGQAHLIRTAPGFPS
jgi:hypothetical protein